VRVRANACINTLQEVLRNLMIHALEYRDEEDAEIAQHTHAKVRGGLR
jgi:ERCC4-related helicase